MRLLLDTHVVLAVIEKRTAAFPASIRQLLAEPFAEFYVSIASLWEIAIKSRLGKLVITPPLAVLPELLDAMGLRLVPIAAQHVLAEIQPEPPTRDPFDRLLLAQCQIEGLRLVTIDRALVAHPTAAR